MQLLFGDNDVNGMAHTRNCAQHWTDKKMGNASTIKKLSQRCRKSHDLVDILL